MMLNLRAAVAAGVFLIAMSAGRSAFAQKPGGILRMYTVDSPATMSMHEEGTVSVAGPMMAVFNNLVMFRPAGEAEQPSVDCARSREQLVMERGWDSVDLPAAPGCQMA